MIAHPQRAIEYIVHWLKTYCEQSKSKGFVVGVSGGIDSALTSTLCALTNLPVIVLNMPIFQAQAEYQRSTEHINLLISKFPNVKAEDIDLSSTLTSFTTVLPKDIQDAHNMANLRSRLRMITLYAFAGHYGYLVAGTGNKIEDFGIGFYTKYGDGGVDISPIADLMKTEVYQLAEYLAVPQSIIQAHPTDGLFENSPTDEEKIGASYSELEWAMNYLTNNYNYPLTERQQTVLSIYQSRHNANLHKMKAIPICEIPKELKL